MGGMFVGMLLLHLVIFILIVLLWIYRKPLAEAAARDKAMADMERKRNPRLKNRPYAWVVMISSTAVLALDMYFDMPSVGVPGLIWKGLLAGPSLTVAVTSFMWVVLAGPQRIRQYVKYAFSAGMLVLCGMMSFTNCFGGVEDVFSGTVTKDMALSHVMYEKTWARGAGLYSRFLPAQAAGRFDLMMDGGDEYIHFHIARRDREVLASMMEGLTVRGKTIRIEDLIPAVEEFCDVRRRTDRWRERCHVPDNVLPPYKNTGIGGKDTVTMSAGRDIIRGKGYIRQKIYDR